MQIGLDVRLTYYTHGGIAKYIRRLAGDLPARDSEHRYTHLYHRGHTETFSPLARRVDCWTPAHHWLESMALSVEVSRHRLDLLHSPDFIPPLWGYRRSVITVHDLTFLSRPEFLTDMSRRYYNGQIHTAVKLADAISADSHATKTDLANLLSVIPEKITVIHLGLDEAFHLLPADEVAATLTRLGLDGYGVRRAGAFAGKASDGGGGSSDWLIRARRRGRR